MLNLLLNWWCDNFHTRSTMPIHGKYTCLNCLREIRCTWESPQPATQHLFVRRHHSQEAAIGSEAEHASV